MSGLLHTCIAMPGRPAVVAPLPEDVFKGWTGDGGYETQFLRKLCKTVPEYRPDLHPRLASYQELNDLTFGCAFPLPQACDLPVIRLQKTQVEDHAVLYYCKPRVRWLYRLKAVPGEGWMLVSLFHGEPANQRHQVFPEDVDATCASLLGTVEMPWTGIDLTKDPERERAFASNLIHELVLNHCKHEFISTTDGALQL